jgi:hypothetical protein
MREKTADDEGEAQPSNHAIDSGFCAEPDLQRPGEECKSSPGHELPGATLPWALSRILHARPTINNAVRRQDHALARERASVCSKDVSNAFIRGKRDNAIAASRAGERRGNGRGGKRSETIEPRRRAKRNAMDRAVVIANESKPGNNLR